MRSSLRFGHPFKKPRRVAFKSVDIGGLHNDWCANLTALARVRIEWAKQTSAGCSSWWGARPSQGPGRDRRMSPGVVPTLCLGIGNVHRSVEGSLTPRKITFPLNITSHFILSNVTVQPALHNGLIPINDAMARCGTIWPVSIVGRPGMLISHLCVE
jgi:hypothetical protein